MAIDPICGMTVDESTALSAERDGVRTFFCCDHCRRKFLGLPPADAPNAPYFCPMCEGVESDKPGICPKCGMALETTAPSSTADDDAELRDMTRRFVIALIFGIPVFILSMGSMGHAAPWGRWISPATSRWLEFLLATPVVLGCGWPFFQRAWRSLLSMSLNMFTLIGIGTGVAYLYSAAMMLFPALLPPSLTAHGAAVYFEAASTITALVLLGQVLELRARRRTGDALRALLHLAPETATVIRGGREHEVPVAEIKTGDLCRVRPGGRIPVDGRIVEGEGAVDASMLTGESEPVDRAAGDEVAAGTVNLSGSFVLSATRVGNDTLFARVVKLVSDAQRSRAPIQRLADRAAAVFVPIVAAAAVATFALWLWLGPEPRIAHALIAAVSVLIVACPCALGLATPMAIMVGIGRGAREGILIRNAEMLEVLQAVDTLVVDKTGTLTEGKPEVISVDILPPFSRDEVLRLAAAVEFHSEHPLARAIVRKAMEGRGEAPLPSATDFRSFAGGGVEGQAEGKRIRAGKPDFLGIPDRAGHGEGSLVGVTVDGVLAGWIMLADPIRATTPEAVDAIHRLGLKAVMLTGDHRKVAESVARELGIDTVVSEASPAQKFDQVKTLQSSGRRVAVAGDGINDAAALAAADVGIAMGSGTDVAMEAAGVTLVKGDLRGIVRAIRLSRATVRTIRQNLFWAFGYNLLAVPVAAGALYPFTGVLFSPMIAAAAMSFSSVSVVANSLRLRGMKL